MLSDNKLFNGNHMGDNVDACLFPRPYCCIALVLIYLGFAGYTTIDF